MLHEGALGQRFLARSRGLLARETAVLSSTYALNFLPPISNESGVLELVCIPNGSDCGEPHRNCGFISVQEVESVNDCNDIFNSLPSSDIQVLKTNSKLTRHIVE